MIAISRGVPLLLSLIFLSGITAPAVGAATHVERLYQDALMKESGERDPEAALELYRQVSELAGKNNRLFVQARLRMASCYELLGKRKDAEEIYLQVIQDSADALSEAAAAAKQNLERLQIQDMKERKPEERMPQDVFVREFQATRFSLSAGPVFARSGANSLEGFDWGVRYRLSPAPRVLAFYVDAGFLPAYHRQIAVRAVAELPHGVQKTVIPEIGAGLATSDGTSGPSVSAALHAFPAHILSVILQTTFESNPLGDSSQKSFPSSVWTAALKMQIAIGWAHTVRRPAP